MTACYVVHKKSAMANGRAKVKLIILFVIYMLVLDACTQIKLEHRIRVLMYVCSLTVRCSW